MNIDILQKGSVQLILQLDIQLVVAVVGQESIKSNIVCISVFSQPRHSISSKDSDYIRPSVMQ